MKCYCLNSGRDGFVTPYECSAAEERLVPALLSEWELHTRHDFECSARTDGGIDDRRSEDSRCALTEDNLVFDGGSIVGYFVAPANGVLFFDRFEHDTLVKHIREKFVGGWGDVSEYNTYSLAKKEGSFPDGAI